MAILVPVAADAAPAQRSSPTGDTVDPAFAQLYQQEFRRVTAVVQSLVGRRDVAEEITQDAFVITHGRWGRVRGYDRPQDFVRRVALNRAVSSLRTRAAERRALARFDGRRAPDGDGGNDTVTAPLWQHVRRLPARQAQVIALVYVEDLAVDEVAAVLGISASSVKTHLQRGREALAQALAADGDAASTDERGAGR
jgi:RNA polymerase sigma-70 factor (ECF subfamily)